MYLIRGYPHLIESTSQEGIPEREEPEGRPVGPGDLKTAMGVPLALLPLPGHPGLPSGSSLGSLELLPGRYSQGDEDIERFGLLRPF